MTVALIVVDIQNDFITGSLAVPGAKAIVAKANVLINEATINGWPIFYTRDWHVPDHPSFQVNGGQWPSHCVMFTDGAAPPPELFIDRAQRIVCKGLLEEAYSGFQGTPLDRLLHYFNVDTVEVCGIATDYCVKATAIDARKGGYETIVHLSACAGTSNANVLAALTEMRQHGCLVVTE